MYSNSIYTIRVCTYKKPLNTVIYMGFHEGNLRNKGMNCIVYILYNSTL